MRQKVSAIGLALIVLLLPLVSLACNSNQFDASIGHEFTLMVGKTAVFKGEQLKIKFVEVTADSRCPSGAQCIVAGEAKCLMLIDYNDSQSSVTYTQLGGSESSQDFFNLYKISFNLEPYPKVGEKIAPEDYRMVMTVIK